MKYAKYKKEYRFKDLKENKEIREKFSRVFVYSRSYPQNYYCWFSDRNNVVFFKRSNNISDDTLIFSVTIKTDSIKAAKVIVQNLTEKEMKRMFNKSNSVIL